MRKLIAAINMTIDGFCDHTAINPDDQIHDHYTELLTNADVILYGRTTYELMKYWQPLVEKPTGEKSMDDFANVMDSIHKIVFSHTLKTQADLQWKTASLATHSLEEEISKLKKQSGSDILIGSPSLIDQATNLNLIDEYQLCIHPVILGKGLPLFKNINEKIMLKRINTKNFKSGAVIHYYEPEKK